MSNVTPPPYQPPVGPQTVPTAQVPKPKSNRGLIWALVAVLSVLVLVVAAGGAWFIFGRGTDATEVRLEALSVATPDAFMEDNVDQKPLNDDLVLTAAAKTTLGNLNTSSPTPPTPIETTATARPVSGALPGLYGGTRDSSTCDPEALVEFLNTHPDKAEAWAKVFDRTPSDIDEFVATLTPTVLTRDTRVTNHGFRNGKANRIPAVLAAGTAVLVDDRGVPAVKCACGNPLLPPATIPPGEPVVYTGTAWPGFDVNTVVNVGVDVRVEVFVLVDIDGGEPFSRPAGTDGSEDTNVDGDEPDDDTTSPDDPELGTGDVQVTLRWEGNADIDLEVTDPEGSTVSYSNPEVASGGNLDVDAIPCNDPGVARVENVFWPDGTAPTGEYTVTLVYYNDCDGDAPPTPVTLRIMVDGEVALEESATLAAPDARESWTFTVGRPGGSTPPASTAAPSPPSANADAVMSAVREQLGICGIFVDTISATGDGGSYWIVNGTASFQSGESIQYSYRYNADTGSLSGLNSDSSLAIDGTSCE